MREIVIRPFESILEYRACEGLQQEVWRFPDREIVPLNELMGIARSHGLLLGAFAEKRMIGFLFGMHGVRPRGWRYPGGRLYHVSRMLAVRPEWQAQGIGFALKRAQRDWCLREGFRHATWTFDPLQAGNAHFNVARLGAISDQYLINVYGRSESVLNRGMETDRLQVDWRLTAARVRRRMEDGRRPSAFGRHPDVEFVNACRIDGRGFLVPGKERQERTATRVAVEIPPRILDLMKADLPLAHRWRKHVRRLLVGHFASGYRVVDFVCTPRDGRDAMAFVLERPRER